MVNDTLTSGGIHFTGLGSGTDFDTMVDKLMEVESYRKARLEIWKSTWEEKITGFQELNTAMLTLSTTLQGMDKKNEFLVKQASSTNEAAVSVTPGPDALEGTHNVIVLSLAKNNILYNNGTSVADPAVDDITGGAAQTFSYTYDGHTETLNVSAGTTLNGLVNLINKNADNPGVRAEVLKIADGTNQLKLVGLDQGADKTITVEAATTLAGFGAGDYVEAQPPANAVFLVDNITMIRTTNTVSDAIQGLTLTLKSEGTMADITVSADKEAIKEQVRLFVSQVNDVRTKILELTKYDDVQEKGSLLTGNYGVEMISQNLKNIISSGGLGFDYDDDAILTLAQLGITTDANEGSASRGLLLLDEDKLDEALDQDIDAVADLFSAWYEGSTDSPDFSYASHVDGTTGAGTFEVKYTISGGTVTGSIGGYTAKYDSTTKQLTALDGPAKGLSLQLTNLADGSYNGNVHMKLGKIGQLDAELKKLTDSNNGTLHILEDNYGDIIENIDKKIEQEERRLTSYETELRLRFARLESLLGQYSGIQTQLSNSINQLPSGSS